MQLRFLCLLLTLLLLIFGAADGYSPAGCNVTQCMTVQFNGTNTRDPAAPAAISQYDPIFASPVGNYTPWQIHISPADAIFSSMFVVYATGQYITGVNDAGSRCDTVTFQQASNDTSTCTARAPKEPNDIDAVETMVQWSTDSALANAQTATGYRQTYTQPQGDVDHFISSLINADIDLDGSANGTISGDASYYSPVIHTTTIGPLEPGVTYFYRVGDPTKAANESALSPIMNFTQVAPFGNASDYPFYYGCTADLGQTAYSNATVYGLMNDMAQAILLIGDLSYADDYNGHSTGQRNGYQPRWDTWGQMMQPIISHLPFLSVMGNHEEESEFRYGDDYVDTFDCEDNWQVPAPVGGDGTPQCAMSYRARFPSANNSGNASMYYSTNVGPAHFLMLNSYIRYDNGSAQYAFVESDLAAYAAANPRTADGGSTGLTPWLIVGVHEPKYSSTLPSSEFATGAHLSSEIENSLGRAILPDSPRTGYLGYQMITAMEPLFYQYGVDVVLTGHEHNYERSYPVYQDKPDNCGPTYIIIGDGGNEEGVENDFTQPQAGWSAYRDLAFGQAEFVILNQTSANWTWKADDGSPLDQVIITRPYLCANHLAPPYLGPAASAASPPEAAPSPQLAGESASGEGYGSGGVGPAPAESSPLAPVTSPISSAISSLTGSSPSPSPPPSSPGPISSAISSIFGRRLLATN
ncbi:hypothetical protein ABBQ38_012398 [Trebouxia sp. C0009 RCD-2024]